MSLKEKQEILEGASSNLASIYKEDTSWKDIQEGEVVEY